MVLQTVARYVATAPHPIPDCRVGEDPRRLLQREDADPFVGTVCRR